MTKIYLKVRELSERLEADVAFILNLAILLLQRVGQGLVAGCLSAR